MKNILKSISNSINILTMQKKLLFLFVLYITIFIAALIIYGSLSILVILNKDFDSVNSTSLQILIILFATLVFVIISIILGYFFRKNIYNPITNIENTIRRIVQGDTDFELSINGKSQLFALAGDINIMIQRFNELISREYTSKLLQKQAELNALQNQINPHFLYNTLESIRGQAIKEGVESVAIMTKALSSLFRYSISPKQNLVTFSSELKNIDNYLLIQQYRFSNKFKFIKDIDTDDSHIFDYYIPKLTIQPIVENAIFHGLETKSETGTLRISAYATEKRLIINIQDDGIGIKEDELNEINLRLNTTAEEIINAQKQNTSSIALINVNERIKLVFGNEFGIKVYSTYLVGTNVEIIIPKISELLEK